MARFNLREFVALSCILSSTTVVSITLPSQAAVLHNDWSYSIDSFNDGMSGHIVGGTKYEIYGTAIKQTRDRIFMAINANTPLEGVHSDYAHDNQVSWGDLFFNFSGQDLNTASANGNLFGVRFSSNNESAAPSLGVFGNVTATDVANQNGLLLDNLSAYNNWVTSHGGTPSIGDFSAIDPYFDQSRHVQNVIASGTKLGDINFVSDVSTLGLDFTHFNATGNHTFAFSFDSSLFSTGDFLYHLGLECDNDITGGIGEVKDVPEPSSLISLVTLGLVCTGLRLRKSVV
ncbi:MAG: PEP-CTERM sorting domain-containing protein [Roseofilum sp. Belize BBD 4]|uniref:XDD3 family exosortase-dependent surface protein n=1 Tax=Roseofilum sp. Belize BBD 4 TaxID=2821500 RepID=UPI000E87C821|nr:XDD3 family exosortase-dependent surface protein [Roseofilum sp. Belize BBD 4]MBP0033279.1 PEP-CTERM sorting domain-containing protein [Roseofilum sp. Belize BBD 4]HBQ97891.1 PEP-CTERM sorting domain-containing protein [Cyanobacteria bacterium UBA11691]